MRVTHDFFEFFQAVGFIMDPRRLKSLGLDIDDVLGAIRPHQVEDVLHFCSENPRYHIVSFVGDGLFLNRYDPRGHRFQLAEGDSDPNYMADRRHAYQWMFGSK